MTDREKIKIWENVCIEYGYATHAEFQFWLEEAEVFFTESGSVVPIDSYVLSKSALQQILEEVDTEQIVTFVLEFLTGVLQFNTIELEKYFLEQIEHMLDDENISFPKELKPSYMENYDGSEGQDT